MTPDKAIVIVKSKFLGRTRCEGQEPFLDEVLVAEIECLRKENKRISAAKACVEAEVGQACVANHKLGGEIKRLRVLVPRTADGVEVAPMDRVWLKPGTTGFEDDGIVCNPMTNHVGGFCPVSRCYSTRKAAEAAGKNND